MLCCKILAIVSELPLIYCTVAIVTAVGLVFLELGPLSLVVTGNNVVSSSRLNVVSRTYGLHCSYFYGSCSCSCAVFI